MGPFEYFEALTVEEAVSLVGKYRNKAKALAGGTDLVVMMREGTIRPQYVISLGRIAGLDYIHFDGEKGLNIGALRTIRSIEQSPQLQPKYRLICQAASQSGSIAVRNVATIGGNLCSAAPSAAMAPALIALSATVKLVSAAGERIVPVEDLFTGSGTTVLKSDELMTEVQVPILPPHTAGVYLKYSSGCGEGLALVAVAVLITVDPRNGTCTDAKVVLGAVAPTPIRTRRAEGVLKGRKIDKELVQKAAQAASDEPGQIMDDILGSAEYRREMVKVFARDAVRKAAWSATSAT